MGRASNKYLEKLDARRRKRQRLLAMPGVCWAVMHATNLCEKCWVSK